MLDKVIKVLSDYKYQIKYTTYHRKSDLAKYKKQEKNLSEDKLLTILTKDNLVIGRVHHVKEKSQFTQKHLQKIIAMFTMFQLPHQEEIIKKLQEISSK